MQIVVTGATGFLGSHFCRTALAAGHQVIACSRRPAGALAALGVKVIVKDLLDLVATDLPEGDFSVVHFATGTEGSDDQIIKVAVEGVRHLYSLAQVRGARRFVHISSMSVYPARVSKDDTLIGGLALEPFPAQRGIYAQSKILAEEALHETIKTHSSRSIGSSMEVDIIRPGLVFGPDMKAGVISGVAITLPPNVMVGLGRPNQGVPLLDITDLSHGLIALLQSEVSPGTTRVFDVLSGDPVSKQEFLQEYIGLSGQEGPQIWVPRFIMITGAYLFDMLLALRGVRKRVTYKVRRLYDFEPRDLPHQAFWNCIGVNPTGLARSCILSTLTIDRKPELPSAEARTRLAQIADSLLEAEALKRRTDSVSTDVVIVGAGRIVSESHVPALKHISGCSVRAVVDTNLDAAQRIASEFDGASAYASIHALDKEIWRSSTAVIATPGFTHFQIAEQLLEWEANLLIEKPAVLTRQEFASLQSIVQRTGRVVTVFQNYRLRPNVVRLWHFLCKYDVGALVKANIVFHSGRIVKEKTRWSHDEKRNRVMIMELAIHPLDLLCLLAGEFTRIHHLSIVDRGSGQSTVSATGMARTELGAEVYFDLDISENARRTQISLEFERCTCILDFFPEGFRVLPAHVTPIHDLTAALERLGGFVSDKIQKNVQGVPKRALPHLAIYRHHFLKLENRNCKEAFSLDAVAPTMRSLYLISDMVYPVYDNQEHHSSAC